MEDLLLQLNKYDSLIIFVLVPLAHYVANVYKDHKETTEETTRLLKELHTKVDRLLDSK